MHQLHHITKKWCCTSFQLSWASKCNGAIYDTIGIMWIHAYVNGINWIKISCCTSFWSSGAKKCICAIHNAKAIIWCQCSHQKHHMTKKVILHLISIILTKQMQQWYWWGTEHHMMLMLVPMALYNTKGHVVYLFDLIDVANAMLPLLSPDQKCHIAHCLVILT